MKTFRFYNGHRNGQKICKYLHKINRKVEFYMSRKGENIHKRKDGRWEGRYIQSYLDNGRAKYVSVYAHSYSEVKRKMRDAIHNNSILSSNSPEDTICYFSDLLMLWLNNSEIRLKKQTYIRYEELIQKHIIPSLGNIKIGDLTTVSINSFIKMESKHGRLDGRGGLSAGSLKIISSIMHSALEFAAQENYRGEFCGKIHIPFQAKNEIEILSTKEQQILEKYLDTDIDYMKLGIIITLNTGLRIGEICGLKWSDIDLEENLLYVQRTVQRVKNLETDESGKKTSLITGEPKTKTSKRIIPIPFFLAKLIKKMERYSTTQYILPGISHEFLDPRTYQYRFHSYLKKCGIRPLNFHSLRHTFATRCIEVGMDIKTVSELLGHSSVNTTLNIYVHSSLENKKNQIARLEDYHGQLIGQQTVKRK